MKLFTKNNELNRYNNQNLSSSFENLIINNYAQSLKKDGINWDDLAIILLQELATKEIKVADQVIEKTNENSSYNELILQHIIDKLYSRPSYHLFLEKFALKLSHSKERHITLDLLREAKINNLSELEKVFKEFLHEQKKLAKYAPNLVKIKDEDDYEQLIDCLVVNPLYENFLRAFTIHLASEFNQDSDNEKVVAPETLTRDSLIKFFQVISTDITTQIPPNKEYKKGKLYVELDNSFFNYTILKANGELVKGMIHSADINSLIYEHTTEEELKQYLPNILNVTALRGHTNQLAVNNTASLRDKAIHFITTKFNTDPQATNLPPNNFIQREEAKFILNQWLNAGNLPNLTQLLLENSHQRYEENLNRLAAQAKNHREVNNDIKDEIDAVKDLMKAIMDVVASLGKDKNEKDNKLNSYVQALIIHLKKLKNFYDKTPILFANEPFPKTDGNFNEFVCNFILNQQDFEQIEYTSQGETWYLDWSSLVAAIVKNKFAAPIYNKENGERDYLLNEDGELVPAAVILREELKLKLLAYLNDEPEYYHKHALQEYQKEQAALTQSKHSEAYTLNKELTLPDKPINLPTITLEEARKEAYRHYDMRHVLTLKSYKTWTTKEKSLQQQHNRILQPNFMEGIIDEQLYHAKMAQEEWLTDVLVPRLSSALYLNIAARLITDYRVDIEEVNKLAKKLWHDISMSNAMDKLSLDWQNMTIRLAPLAESHLYDDCVRKATERMKKLYPDIVEDSFDYDFKFKSCLEMERNKVRKKLTNEVVGAFLDNYLDSFAQQDNLEKKPQLPIGDNKDYVFIGPSASGKSTISNQYVKEQDRMNYVSMSTDDYRGIYLPGTDDFEQLETEQIFIRTQDSAYLVSELVEDRMKSFKDKRPNMIVDGVTYKPAHRALVETNNNSVVVWACLDDVAEVVKRTYNRATREDTSAADKGRHVNTTSLLHMHKTASIGLVAYCAPNTTIAVYNTNIRPNEVPALIATIDTHGTKTITINEEQGALLHLTSFFNKKRLNISARNDSSLFISKLQKPAFQVESLFAVLNYNFSLVLNDHEGNPYLIFKKTDQEGIEMTIIDPEQVREKLSPRSSESGLIKMMLLYGKYGSLKEVQKQCLLHDGGDQLVESMLDEATVKHDIKSVV
ncbi:hypothetical protein ACNVED_01165 [Legionella sp. D16C41]|uniref:hypothetical protein n=1 Tax=Legionella sp. D16C41 TaxID=3402688 RepID=UPI003AF63E3B